MPLSTSVCCSVLQSEQYNTLQHTLIAKANANRRYPLINVCVLQRVAVRETLQHTATLSNTLQRTSIEEDKRQINLSKKKSANVCALQRVAVRGTLQHTATHCNTLQHTATHCNTLHHTATHCTTLQQHTYRSKICSMEYANTATHCNILPHTATHCNTLQHTATHCNTLQQ